MAERGTTIPTKLKDDAIIEALFEVRFDIPRLAVPEIFLGRMADRSVWRGFGQRPLPAAQVPAHVRRLDSNLRFQPVLELTSADKERSVRIGPQVLSYHRLRRYCGWTSLKPELTDVVDGLFTIAESLNIQRLGLRYMNALRPAVHTVRSISDLDLKVTVANDEVRGNINLNFTTNVFTDTQCAVRIATREFVQGDVPSDASVFVDVDVYTKDDFRTKDRSFVLGWIESAHTAEKQNFFRLLPEKTIELLIER